jgi:GH35 family endo-1,4-beta-xylanase
LSSFGVHTTLGDSVKKETVNVIDMPFNEAFRLTKTIKHTDATELQFSAKTTSLIKQGDLLMLQFYGRLPPKKNRIKQSQLITVFEESKTPWTKSLNAGLTLTSDWQKYYFPIHIKKSGKANKKANSAYRLAFRLGFEIQTIELANITLVNLPKNIHENDIPRTRLSYAGENSDADWRHKAQQRIKNIRKAPIKISVTDKNGNAVTNAQIKIGMTKHAFTFGTAMNTYILGQEKTPDSIKYLDAIKQNFNQIVLEGAMKWPKWPNSNTQTSQVINWALYHGLTIRGHNIIWPSWDKSPWQNNENKIAYFKKHSKTLEKKINQRISQIVGRYKGLVVNWDVVNEPYTNNDFMKILGNKSMVDWFKKTRAIDPSSRLFINDYGILVNENNLDDKQLRAYENTIHFLLENGAPLKGIGMQGHFREVMTSPENLLSTLDIFAKFTIPIVLTEFDHQTSDQQLQARYLHDVLTVMFSHPSVHGFLMWGFWDGSHWQKNAPLYNKDWSLKPSGKVYQSLVLDKWWTRLSGNTNKNGLYESSGFLGEYTITITYKGKSHKYNFVLTKTINAFKFRIEN